LKFDKPANIDKKVRNQESMIRRLSGEEMDLRKNVILSTRVKGWSLVELAIGMTIFIPLLIVVSDSFMLFFSTQLSDATCQDAARVAASGDPSTAKERAAAIVARANSQSRGALANFQLVSITQNSQASQYANGGPVEGSVTVETQVDFTPQFIQWCVGRNLLQLRSRQTCPFSYIKPPPS
jgi:hypothetical protein